LIVNLHTCYTYRFGVLCFVITTVHQLHSKGYIFNNVCLWVFVNAMTVEPFEMSSWTFYGSKMWSKAWTSSKMAALRCTAALGWWRSSL